jgi:GNAT superfamily N-acetyltransferase
VTSQGWQDVYSEVIPEHEQQPVPWLQSLAKDGSVPKVEVFETKSGDKTVAFSMVSDYGEGPDGPQKLLPYLGVAPDLQSRGIGGQHLRELLQAMKDENPNTKGLLLEVDKPTPQMTEPERALARRRLLFYRNNGGQLIDANYQFPGSTDNAPVESNLIWFDFDRGGPTKNGMDHFLRSIYKNGYQMADNDPLIQSVTSSLKDIDGKIAFNDSNLTKQIAGDVP